MNKIKDYFLIDRNTIINIIMDKTTCNKRKEIMLKLYNNMLNLEEKHEIINKLAVSTNYEILFYYTSDNRKIDVKNIESTQTTKTKTRIK